MSFTATLTISGSTATIALKGELDASTAVRFHDTINGAAEAGATELLLNAEELSYLSSAGLRTLVFARQKMGQDVRIAVVGALEPVARTIRLAGFDHSIELSEA